MTMHPRGIGIVVVGQWWSYIYGLVTPRYSVPCCSMYASLNPFLAPVWLSGCVTATMGSLQPPMRYSDHFCCHSQEFGFGFGGAGRWWGPSASNGAPVHVGRQGAWRWQGPLHVGGSFSFLAPVQPLLAHGVRQMLSLPYIPQPVSDFANQASVVLYCERWVHSRIFETLLLMRKYCLLGKWHACR